MEAFSDREALPTWGIEAIDYKLEVECNLRGHLEAAMASEATKVVVRDNMHIIPRVMEVAYLKSEVKIDIWGHWGCLEVGHGLRGHQSGY